MWERFSWVHRPGFWLVSLLALGLGLRAYHYLSNPPIWHDEAALIINVLDKTPREQLGALYFSEAAPPLFLWIEKGVVEIFGEGIFALRLVPFLASCASFVLLVLLARPFLSAAALLWFALLLGCSDRVLWHASEAKPYAIDMLVSTIILALLAWAGLFRRPADQLRLQPVLVLLTLLSPVLIFLSFPACFVLGAAALCLLPFVWQSARPRVWLLYGAFALAMGSAFLLLLAGPIQQQKAPRLMDCWIEAFPNWQAPWLVPVHLAKRVTEVFRYASEPIGNVLVPVALVGALWLWRRGDRLFLGFLVLPLGLTAFAWLLSQYPFGPSRVIVFLAPACLLLVAAGLPVTFAWLKERQRLVALPVIAVALVPLVQAGYRVAVPWPRTDLAKPSAFVLERRRADEPVVGCFWELSYYLRDLGVLYRPLDPKPTDPPSVPPTSTEGLPPDRSVIERLWLLMETSAGPPQAVVECLPPSGGWRLIETFGFERVLALYVERVP